MLDASATSAHTKGGILEVTGSVHFSMSEDDIKYMVAALKPNCLRSAHA